MSVLLQTESSAPPKTGPLQTSDGRKIELLRMADVVRETKNSKSQVDRWRHQDPTFPKSFSLGNSVPLWLASDLADWIMSHKDSANGKELETTC